MQNTETKTKTNVGSEFAELIIFVMWRNFGIFWRNIGKSWEILPQFTRFHVKKIEPKKYICGEK